MAHKNTSVVIKLTWAFMSATVCLKVMNIHTKRPSYLRRTDGSRNVLIPKATWIPSNSTPACREISRSLGLNLYQEKVSSAREHW